MAWDELDVERVEQIIRQISGNKIDRTKELINPAIIKGSGDRNCVYFR